MSSIGSPPKRAELRTEPASSKMHADALAQRQLDDQNNTALQDSPAVYEDATHLHMVGILAPESQVGTSGLEMPGLPAEGHAEGLESHHSPAGTQAGSTLATHLEHARHIFHRGQTGVPSLPFDEAANAHLLENPSQRIDAARQRALQQGQHGFIVPLTLRRPRRVAYTEKSTTGSDSDWDVEAIESLVGTLHVSVNGGMQTHDDPAMRKERRFRRWLVMLAHRRRMQRRQGRASKK